jgi:hypothetical protein
MAPYVVITGIGLERNKTKKAGEKRIFVNKAEEKM